MLIAPSFYNTADQNIYNQGYSFIPQERFRGGAFNVPTTPDNPTGVTALPTAMNMGGGGGGENFNPYMPNNDVRTDFIPNYDFRRYSEYGLNPSTMDRKQMDMNQEYFYDRPSQLQQKVSGLMNFIPGIGTVRKGAEFVGGILDRFMPVNQRAILENQLRGQGVFTDSIGRIAIGPGGEYNTPEGIMAGYNANKMTDATFDKRTGNIAETLSNKYGFTTADINNLNNGIITPEMEQKAKMSTGKTSNLLTNYININKAKANFLNQKTKTAEIAAFKEAEKVRKESERQYDPGTHGETNYGMGEGGQSYSGDALGDKDQGFGIAAGGYGGPVSNRTGRGRTDYMNGGLANLVDIYD